MKSKILLGLFVFVFILTPMVSVSSADLLLGQKHNYTVTFRGNGEAVVFTRIAFTNTTEDDWNYLNFSIGDYEIYELVAYQQELPDVCLRSAYNRETGQDNCLEFGPPDYYEYNSPFYYRWNESDTGEYTKLKVDNTNNQYKVNLAKTIAPNQQAAIIMAYFTKDFVEPKIWGGFKFNFKTLKVEQRVNESNIGIDVDSELYLKGVKSNVDYYDDSLGKGGYAVEMAAVKNPALDDISTNIGSGQIVKQSKNLAPNETFNVKGNYATTKIRLNILKITVSGLIILLVILVLLFLIKYAKKKEQGPPPVKLASEFKPENSVKDKNIVIINSLYLLWGFISALITFLFGYLFSYLDYLERHIHNIPKNWETIVFLVYIVLLLLLFVGAIFGAPIYFASRRGWRAFFSVLIDTAIFALIFLVILLLIFSIMS